MKIGENMNRNDKIIKVSIYGIAVNVLLVIFKGIVGFLSNSISVILDAINNLTDVLSSVITIIGTKLASRKPDKRHPYGYGRVEYFSAIIVAIIVLFAGFASLKESLSKIINGGEASYSIISLSILCVAIFVKYFFGSYVKNEGKKLDSNSLIASGIDAISDSFISLSTFLGAVISFLWHISLEGYIGFIISIMILKTAINILKDTIDEMIGIRASKELTTKLRKRINKYENVLGVYDLTLHNYGPNNIIGTVHVEVPESMLAIDIHKLTRTITVDIYNELGIVLTVGIYSSNNSKYDDMKKDILNIIKSYKSILQLHAFYVEDNTVSFDLVFDFEETNMEEVKKEIETLLKEKYKGYNFIIIIDKDYSD